MSFYEKCAEILNVDYDGEPFAYYKRTRWNNRKAGSGRYPGFGLIRKFGEQYHISFYDCNKILDSEDAVFLFLRSYKP